MCIVSLLTSALAVTISSEGRIVFTFILAKHCEFLVWMRQVLVDVSKIRGKFLNPMMAFQVTC